MSTQVHFLSRCQINLLEMWERIWSVNITDCLMFTDLPTEFERMVPILARGVDSSAPDSWKDVQVCSCWGMRNYDLSTEEGKLHSNSPHLQPVLFPKS